VSIALAKTKTGEVVLGTAKEECGTWLFVKHGLQIFAMNRGGAHLTVFGFVLFGTTSLIYYGLSI
jgi:hypothetical protein